MYDCCLRVRVLAAAMSLVQYSGLKLEEGNAAEAVVDGNEKTKAVFKAATMQFTVQTAA